MTFVVTPSLSGDLAVLFVFMLIPIRGDNLPLTVLIRHFGQGVGHK